MLSNQRLLNINKFQQQNKVFSIIITNYLIVVLRYTFVELI